jgi:hypothetical protein
MHVAAFVCLGVGWLGAIVFNFIAMAAHNSMYQAVNNVLPPEQRLRPIWDKWRVTREYRRHFLDPKLPLQKRRAVIGAVASWVLGIALCGVLMALGGPFR